MALISLDHVGKIYPKATRPALDDITLHIGRGDFVFLVGASGSGKTSLLRLLTREEEATAGEIRVGGHDLRRLRDRQVPHYRRSIGTVFQDYKLLNNKTVWENVAFALEVIGTSKSTIKSLVPKVLDTVGLTGKERNYPHELSGGEQQRVTIARAYVNHPQILLADEPTGNLDPTTSLGIMEVLDAISRTGTTIVMATHNEEIVNSMRKRVVELHAGKIVRDEEHGSYDSTLYFPDAKTQAQAHEAISTLGVRDTNATSVQDGTQSHPVQHIDQEGTDRTQQAEQLVETVSEATMSGQYGDEGIARLARSVHAGRTGRYGEVFVPLEHTLTWGHGLSADGSNEANAEDNAAEGPQYVEAVPMGSDTPAASADDAAANHDATDNAAPHDAVELERTSEMRSVSPAADASVPKPPAANPPAPITSAAATVPAPPAPPAAPKRAAAPVPAPPAPPSGSDDTEEDHQ